MRIRQELKEMSKKRKSAEYIISEIRKQKEIINLNKKSEFRLDKMKVAIAREKCNTLLFILRLIRGRQDAI